MRPETGAAPMGFIVAPTVQTAFGVLLDSGIPVDVRYFL